MRSVHGMRYKLQNPLVYKSQMVNEYLDAMKAMRKNTYNAARQILSLFPHFVQDHYHFDEDKLLKQIKTGKVDRYKVLIAYVAYAKSKGKSGNRQRRLMKSARQLFEFHDVEFSDHQLRRKVKVERSIKRAKTATDKEEIVTIMQATQEPFLQLAELWHAATGRRPEEVFSLRHCDLNFNKSPATFTIRGEFTKMGNEQERPMTDELASRTREFLVWKHRARRISINYKDGTAKQIKVVPQMRPDDLLFTIYLRDETHFIPDTGSIYDTHAENLGKLLDSIGKGERVNSKDPRSPRKFTFYRLRDHVKTTISDLGFGDYGEWYIGHSGSTYYNQPEAKRTELFRKIEPYLTYLDITALEARAGGQDARIAELEAQLVKQKQESDNRIREVVEQILAERHGNKAATPAGQVDKDPQ